MGAWRGAKICVVALACVTVVACTPADVTTSGRDEMERTYVIPANGKLRYDDNLEIGAGNFWTEDYVEADGSPQSGITAGLWFFVRDGSQPSLDLRVHTGQVVAFGLYRVEVLEIGLGQAAPFVRVAISEAD